MCTAQMLKEYLTHLLLEGKNNFAGNKLHHLCFLFWLNRKSKLKTTISYLHLLHEVRQLNRTLFQPFLECSNLSAIPKYSHL
ncbi:hypothetical protein AQUCO_01800189v1 [Aquilegia coerulea]|uniref:Uncharacterized protein n=1 Tax=Aquilegia coerulea TaxID=218851 RepID=A0A2G5DKB7_AQUCA|nr:hypothetical protein AQUCO_01800189v1 [Aquilegia coerulea]